MFALKEYPNAQNNYKITPYKQRLEKLSMSSLNRRRINASNIYLYDVINGNINCPSIRQILSINEGARRLRSNEFVKITDKKMKLTLSAPIPQICKFANMIPAVFTNSTSRANFIKTSRSMPDSIFGSLC